MKTVLAGFAALCGLWIGGINAQADDDCGSNNNNSNYLNQGYVNSQPTREDAENAYLMNAAGQMMEQMINAIDQNNGPTNNVTPSTYSTPNTTTDNTTSTIYQHPQNPNDQDWRNIHRFIDPMPLDED